jgi:hypothetical protein
MLTQYDPTRPGGLQIVLPDMDPDNPEMFPVYSSYPLDTPENRHKVWEIMLADCHPLETIPGVHLEFSDYIAHAATMQWSVDGTSSAIVRLLLPQSTELPVEVVDPVAMHKVGVIVNTMRRLPPYDPPLVLASYVSRAKESRGRVLLKFAKG